MKLRFTKHALERIFVRGITPSHCRKVFENGEILESYPDDLPLPSELRLGIVDGRALHVVTALDKDIAHVITAYEPDPKLWDKDFRKRK